MTDTRVGTVEILRDRVYQIDPTSAALDASTAVVTPGVYPLYRDFDCHYWLLTGRLNYRGLRTLSDGMFAIHQGDDPSGPEVTFPSKRFAPSEWAELLAHEQATEGHPAQRIRITITDGGVQA